jgi:hypothetical protein
MIDQAKDPRTAVTEAHRALEQATALQQTALEQLAAARAELFEAPLLGGRQELPNEEHAASYQATAAMLRRRAKMQPAAHQAESIARAEWFEKRAAIKRTGGVMPRDLRTPGERLGFVDGLRRALLLVLEATEQLELEDVSTFVRRLVDDDDHPLHGEQTLAAAALARDSVAELAGILLPLLEQLGLGYTEEGAPGFWPAPQPLVEDLEPPTPAPAAEQNNGAAPDVA